MSRQEASSRLPESVNALRVADSLRREIEEALQPWDLTWAQYDTLLALRNHEARRVRGAKGLVGEGAPRRIDRLVGLGYLKKTPDPEHSQARLVVLTEEGKEALSQATLALENLSVVRDPTDVVQLEVR